MPVAAESTSAPPAPTAKSIVRLAAANGGSAAAPATSVKAAQRIEELGRIILAYSEVTDRLQKSHEQLQQTVAALRQELGEKNRQLERKNRLAALGEMAAGLAHEIRNPLGGIQLYASMLADDLSDRPQALTVVRKISDGVRRLESLVSQTLAFTREMPANIADADAAQIVEQAIELAHPAMQSRAIACDADGPRPLAIKADPIMLGQALLNLLLNAAEAMDSPDGAGRKITVRWADDGAGSDSQERGKLYLSVRDQGPGIAPPVLEKLFNPFFTTKDNGTGLGLAIVHRIVEAHDGSISVSNPPGGGALFEIRI